MNLWVVWVTVLGIYSTIFLVHGLFYKTLGILGFLVWGIASNFFMSKKK